MFSQQHEECTLQVLLYAQLRNNSNNMVKVITGGLDKLTDEALPEIQQQTSISAVINGHHSAGIVVMKQALQLAVAKAKSHGCAVIGTNYTATGSGAIGYITPLKHATAVNLHLTMNHCSRHHDC